MAENNRAKLELTAENRTKPAFDALKRSINEVESASSRVSGVLRGLGVGIGLGAVVSTFQQIFRQAAEAERASLRLDAAIRATGNAAGILRAELDQIADEIKVTTVFDDDEIRKGLSSLLRFREVQGDVFRQAARLAPDLATALDINVTEAYQRLGRALQDPATGLRSLRDAGISVRDTQIGVAETLERTGDKAKAQKIVLDELAKSVGGAAAAENQGLHGASKAVGKAWDDMLKAIGRTETFTAIAHAGLDLLKRDLEAIEFFAKQNAASGALGGARTGRIGGAPIRAGDFGGESEFEARRREMEAAIKFFQARGGAQKSQAASPFQTAAKQLQDEAVRVQELTRFEEVLSAIQLGRYGKLTAVERQRLLDLAAQVDVSRDLARQEKERAAGLAEVPKEVTAASNKEIERRAAVRKSIIEVIDPIQKYRDEIAKVEQALEQGDITPAQASAALFFWQEQIEAAQGLSKQVEKTADEMTEFMRAAARGMQSAMSDFFFDIMQGKLNDLPGRFKQVLDRMVADILAAKAATALFGKDFGKGGGEIGGLVGDFLKIFTGGGSAPGKPDIITSGPGTGIDRRAADHVIFGFGGGGGAGIASFFKDLFGGIGSIFGFADGGDFFGGRPILVGEQGPEIILPRAPGTVVPNHAMGGRTVYNTVTVHVAVPPNIDKRSADQLATLTGIEVQRRLVRNT